MNTYRNLQKDVQEKPLVTREQIQERVQELGRQITEDYEGKDLTVVCILRGATVFFADLIREIDLPITIDFLRASSYGESAQTSGRVKIIRDLDNPIKDKDVLLVEDIIDSGTTMSLLKPELMSRGCRSLKIAALLDKPEGRKVPLEADYWGFRIPMEFVVGYGLDYAEKYRNLPYIGVLKREVYE